MGQHENAIVQVEPNGLARGRRSRPAHPNRPPTFHAPFDGMAGRTGPAVKRGPQDRIFQTVPDREEGDFVVARLGGCDQQGIEVAIEIEAGLAVGRA